MMNRDGVRQGYDLNQLKYVRAACRVPLIASGGAGAKEHFRDAFLDASVDGALAASVFHLAEPQGPTCHTGATSCFHVYDREPPPGWPWFAQLADELAARKNADPATSYTARLHARDLTKNRAKVGEEGVETALAAVSGDDNGLAYLLYHLTVLMHARSLDWSAVLTRLHERHRGIGLHPEGANKP
ncbi:phosphoribosyl-ATP diphosphatase [Cardiobacterium valvarum F0432]|uniref:phosphoribosyl-ATP diphosphatase n=1 Tax=Cardiobacterium valvarum F0432 TaxID=797473 RepID=G9ZBD5_9GAMM|nr:phosphoribosyl-ATP diphosphatase [Cardiobacterium valvarum F0432]